MQGRYCTTTTHQADHQAGRTPPYTAFHQAATRTTEGGHHHHHPQGDSPRQEEEEVPNQTQQPPGHKPANSASQGPASQEEKTVPASQRGAQPSPARDPAVSQPEILSDAQDWSQLLQGTGRTLT